MGGKYDVCLVSPILRGFWYIWTQVSCNCENPPLRPLPSFLSFVLSELRSPAPSVTISSNLHQLSSDSPPSPVVNPIHVPPYSPNAPPSTGGNPQMTIPTYQPNPPVTNFRCLMVTGLGTHKVTHILCSLGTPFRMQFLILGCLREAGAWRDLWRRCSPATSQCRTQWLASLNS